MSKWIGVHCLNQHTFQFWFSDFSSILHSNIYTTNARDHFPLPVSNSVYLQCALHCTWKPHRFSILHEHTNEFTRIKINYSFPVTDFCSYYERNQQDFLKRNIRILFLFSPTLAVMLALEYSTILFPKIGNFPVLPGLQKGKYFLISSFVNSGAVFNEAYVICTTSISFGKSQLVHFSIKSEWIMYVSCRAVPNDDKSGTENKWQKLLRSW